MTEPQPFTGVASPPRQRAASLFCVNWEQYGLREIWQMVEREDGRISWAQATAWERMAQLCGHQAQRLRHAAGELSQLWPPERSETAQVFVAHVQAMAKSMDDSAAAARTTSTALEQLTQAIADTRRKIALLVDQRQVYEQQYQERERETLPWLRGHDALIGSQREDSDQAARQVMRELDQVAMEANSHMTIPGRYLPVQYDTAEPWSPGLPAIDAEGKGSTIGSVGAPAPTLSSPLPSPGMAPALNVHRAGLSSPLLNGGLGTIRSTQAMPGQDVVPADQPPTALPYSIGAETSFRSLTNGRLRLGAKDSPAVSPSSPRRSGAPPMTPRPTAAGAAPRGVPAPMLGAPMTGRPAAVPRGVLDPAGSRTSVTRGRQFGEPLPARRGVPAVLWPPPESTRHEPGPGVIGIDR